MSEEDDGFLYELEDIEKHNVLTRTLIISVEGAEGKEIQAEYRIRESQLKFIKAELYGDNISPFFLLIPTAEALLFINPERLIGARLLFDFGILEMPDVKSEELISIPAEDFGRNLVEFDDDDDGPYDEITYFLAKKLGGGTDYELNLLDFDESDAYNMAVQIIMWGDGEAPILFEDDDGEDVFLNPGYISLVEFKLENHDDFLVKVITDTRRDYWENDDVDEDEE